MTTWKKSLLKEMLLEDVSPHALSETLFIDQPTQFSSRCFVVPRGLNAGIVVRSQNVVLRDVVLLTEEMKDQETILLSLTSPNCIMENVRCYGGAIGIFMERAWRSRLIGCECRFNSFGLQMQKACNNMLLCGVNLRDCDEQGLGVGIPVSSACTGVTLVNCDFEANPKGLVIQNGSQIICENCHFEKNATAIKAWPIPGWLTMIAGTFQDTAEWDYDMHSPEDLKIISPPRYLPGPKQERFKNG